MLCLGAGLVLKTSQYTYASISEFQSTSDPRYVKEGMLRFSNKHTRSTQQATGFHILALTCMPLLVLESLMVVKQAGFSPPQIYTL